MIEKMARNFQNNQIISTRRMMNRTINIFKVTNSLSVSTKVIDPNFSEFDEICRERMTASKISRLSRVFYPLTKSPWKERLPHHLVYDRQPYVWQNCEKFKEKERSQLLHSIRYFPNFQHSNFSPGLKLRPQIFQPARAVRRSNPFRSLITRTGVSRFHAGLSSSVWGFAKGRRCRVTRI